MEKPTLTEARGTAILLGPTSVVTLLIAAGTDQAVNVTLYPWWRISMGLASALTVFGVAAFAVPHIRELRLIKARQTLSPAPAKTGGYEAKPNTHYNPDLADLIAYKINSPSQAPNPFPIDPRPTGNPNYLSALHFAIDVAEWINLRTIGRPQRSDYPPDSPFNLSPTHNPGVPYDNRTAYEYRQRFHERANAILRHLKSEFDRRGDPENDARVEEGPAPYVVASDIKKIVKYLRYLEDGTTGEPW